jgi:hypothetical protein
MFSLTPVEPLGVQYETCETFNAYVALEIARADNSLPGLLRCFRAAARELSESHPHPLLDELAAGPLGCRVSKRSQELACADEQVIEQICFSYFQRAADLRLLDPVKYDPHLMAHSVLSVLWSGDEWETDCTLFRHSWRVEHYYKAQGWHLLCPWVFAFGTQLPRLRELEKIDALLLQVEDSGNALLATTLARRAGLPVTDANIELLWFLCFNRAGVCILGRGVDAQIVATETAIPQFGLLSELSSVEGWVLNPCRRWAFRLAESNFIQAELGALESFQERFGGPAEALETADVAVKVALRQLAAEQTDQGLPSHLRRAIVQLLETSQRVVIVPDLRRMLGVPHLRIDPFSVTPGRVLVYAPSPKFLDSNQTAFVLREWVQDIGRQRARITPDRILTPLSPIAWSATEEDLLRAIRTLRTFSLFGIAFWADVRRVMRLEVPAQARRWAEHHLLQRTQKILRSHGLIVAGDVFFSGSRWQGLPASRAALRHAANDLRTAPEWIEPRAFCQSEMIEVVERLTS